MKIVNGELVIPLDEFVHKMDDEQKKEVLESFVFEEVMSAVEKQLRHETNCDWWNTSGDRDGDKIRDWISKIQGTEAEFRKDMEHKLRMAESDRDNYKKYYDFYFKIFHHKDSMGENSLFETVKKQVGYVA